MVRVVLDTNILVSAAWKPDGLEAKLVAMAAAQTLEWIVSEQIIAEYREVLTRPKFTKIRAVADAVLQLVETKAMPIVAPEICEVAKDPDDNRFLDAAIASDAQFLITGNLQDYPPLCWKTVQIVNARQFFDLQA
jgi:uncharacterized protein